MIETSGDDLFLATYRGEEMVGNLLSDSSGDAGGGGLSLAAALLPLVESPSSPLMPWVLSTRYKTELCSSYAATGLCKYAERCQFAHGLGELHVPSRHPKYKTELCRSYHTMGYCFYGNRCLFVHSPTEQRPAHRRKRNVPCRSFRTFGVCPFGTRCNFLHDGDGGSVGAGPESPDAADDEGASPAPGPQPHAKEWKPRGALCRTFNAFGFCLYGTRCRFQHGLPSTVKSSDSSLTSGGPQVSQMTCRALSPGSEAFSSASPTSTSSSSPLATPPVEPMAHNAFTFSSQHLNDLLLPLALRLQQLESSQTMAASTQGIWDSTVA